MKLGELVTNKAALQDPLTIALIKHYGAETELVLRYPADPMYSFPNNLNVDTLMIVGDDAWGAVWGVTSSNGHLVVSANYGDGGNFEFSPTLERGDHHNDLITAIDPNLWINTLSVNDLIVAKRFSI